MTWLCRPMRYRHIETFRPGARAWYNAGKSDVIPARAVIPSQGFATERAAMSLQTLGYIGLRTKNLEDWTAYAERFLGMQLVDKSRGTASFRMDDKKQRLVVHEDAGDAPGFFGWEVADATALDAYAANLERHKVSFARGSRALAEERKVRDLIVLSDPAGNRLEIFHGAETTTDPFKPGRAISR